MTGRTLSGQLRNRVTVIVAALALALAIGTLLAARGILLDGLDNQLDAALERQSSALDPRDNRAPGIDVPGMAEGTIVVARMPDGSLRGNVVGRASVEPLTVADAEALIAVATDGGKHTVTLPTGGEYRAEARTTDLRVVVALPLAATHQAIWTLAVFALGIAALTTAAAALVTWWTASRATRPLQRLSRTASEVSQLPLHTGDVNVPAAVDVGDLAPEHEVRQLADAFGLMLANVDGAFRARQASESNLRRFVADASHELRNPLASIRGYAELAERHPLVRDDADLAFALSRVRDESERMTRLVGDLLLLARLDARVDVEPQPVDLVETVLHAVSDARAAGPEYHWRLELPDEPVWVWGDADQLHQVVVNLLSNARAHTPSGTTVTTSVSPGDPSTLTVCDDGPGIPADLLPSVFERFSRADAARAHSATPSTGLGLAIVRGVVEQFGGTTSVASGPGRTCFRVELRRSLASESQSTSG